MTNSQNNHENTNHSTNPPAKRDQHRYEEERQDWQKADRDRRCPGCDGNGVQVTMGRREPYATICYICRGAPHPADALRTHRGTLDGMQWHESISQRRR